MGIHPAVAFSVSCQRKDGALADVPFPLLFTCQSQKAVQQYRKIFVCFRLKIELPIV